MGRPSPQDQDVLKRAIDASQTQMRMEERVTQRVLEHLGTHPALGGPLRSGVLITQVFSELRGLLSDAMTLSSLRDAIKQLEQQEGYAGLEDKLVALMKGIADGEQPSQEPPTDGATATPDPGSPPPSGVGA